jgi:ABC-type nitrate/sulfonate/bicarbonate transport system substrate-binding protein
MAIEEGAFEERGIHLEWTDVPEGTGKMCQLLKDDGADLAIILTEGIIKSIIEGNPARIIQGYIASPLLWGIHVAATSPFHTLADLENKKAAISRFGSGSHLMAYVNAQNMGWSTNELQFEIVHTIDGAVEALEKGKADYFMWEHFTTKPLVSKGVFRRIADCPTPWPCFVIAASQKCLQEQPAVVRHVIEIINLYTSEFKRIPSIDRTLSNRYEQQLEDIQNWLDITQWSQQNITTQLVDNVQDTLLQLKLIDTTLDAAQILTSV